MFLEFLAAIVCGVIFGTLTGITPGLHINLVSVILLSFSPVLLAYTPAIVLGVFIIAMSVTHTFTDFISAIYLGAPADDTALAVLPGHQLLLQGRGHEAVTLTVIGSLLGLIIVLMLTPVLILSVPLIFEQLKNFIGIILIGVVAFMILRDRTLNKKFWNGYVFLLSGIFGLFVFALPSLKDPLLPMFSGLFGVSMLLVSLSGKVTLPQQRITAPQKIPKKELAAALSSGVFSGSLVSLFPGLGPAQAAVLGMQITKKISVPATLILLGSINTVSMMLSLITLYTIDKARNGSIVVVATLLGAVNQNMLAIFFTCALIAGCIATFAALFMSSIFAQLINKINYSVLNLAIIIFIAGLVLYFTGILGFLVLVVGTAIGLIPSLTKINKSHLMGCLLLPVILWSVL